MTLLSHSFGWRGALIGAGLIAVVALLFLVLQRDLLAPVERHEAHAPKSVVQGAGVLLSAPVLMCFGFFVLLAGGIVGIQAWGVPTLTTSFHLSREMASATLTGFLIGGAVGIAIGGWAAAHTENHARLAGIGMGAACGLIALTATGVLPALGVAVALTVAGLLAGITQPSRDLLVRKTTPKGSTGKVYGFVYSGLDAGSATAPLLFSWLLDQGRGDIVLYSVAILWGLAIFTIISVRRQAVPPAAA
jgi:predicted MFS family arabinose efflux permease